VVVLIIKNYDKKRHFGSYRIGWVIHIAFQDDDTSTDADDLLDLDHEHQPSSPITHPSPTHPSTLA
jgi:hypothetical protein